MVQGVEPKASSAQRWKQGRAAAAAAVSSVSQTLYGLSCQNWQVKGRTLIPARTALCCECLPSKPGGLSVKEWAMKNEEDRRSLSKDLNKTPMDVAELKQWGNFPMQVAMEPCSQLGTGQRCKVKGCAQPVYVHESGLCSYHRMMEAERAFEDRLRERQQQAMIERNRG